MIGQSEITQQAAIAMIAVWILELIKRWSKIPWVSANTSKANRLVSVVMAVASGIGITFAWHGSFIDGGQLIITVPSAADLLHLAYNIVFAAGAQEAFYRSAVKPRG